MSNKNLEYATIFWGWNCESVQLQRVAERIGRADTAGTDTAAVYTIRSGGEGTGERCNLGAGLHQPN